MRALRGGNFYATCGPLIESIEYDGERVSIRCSPVQAARLVGPKANGMRAGAFDGSLLAQVEFALPRGWKYAYVELEDEQGRRAWTNSLLVT